jgi:hypothetical protein
MVVMTGGAMNIETSRQPRRYLSNFQLRIEPELLDEIRKRAKQERRSASEFVRHAAKLQLRRKRAA